MEFLELARNRYSVRAYKPDPVPDDLLQQVLEAARLAPTAANCQPFRLIVIHTEGRKEELRRIYDRDWFVQAPIIICAVAVAPEAWRKTHLFVDVAIAMDHLILTATDLGLGTCWIAAFNRSVTPELLGLPDDVEPVVFTTLGYAADEPGPKERRPLSELVRYERW